MDRPGGQDLLLSPENLTCQVTVSPGVELACSEGWLCQCGPPKLVFWTGQMRQIDRPDLNPFPLEELLYYPAYWWHHTLQVLGAIEPGGLVFKIFNKLLSQYFVAWSGFPFPKSKARTNINNSHCRAVWNSVMPFRSWRPPVSPTLELWLESKLIALTLGLTGLQGVRFLLVYHRCLTGVTGLAR